ncbi:MAG: alpha-ketoglutarate-dependent dioxygenase AlkB [Flavobacteriales bacterium]|nr:alpha-ketoglutarate-dependent dioxygenase AlkB [Flavobacteriales bacterium]
MPTEVLIDQNSVKLLYDPEAFRAISFEKIVSSIPWQQNKIFLFGKEYLEPRLTYWCGPSYKYSSITWPSTPWINILQGIREELEFKLNFPFNAVLCNYYRNGADSMGWHSDNEPEIDQMMIASVSFGETRRFGVRERSSRATQSFNLQHGSLLIMENFQKDWQHCIPTSKRPMNPRLNLTFRHIIAPKKPSMP